jgi:solute:Na+ symporter, SSS family
MLGVTLYGASFYRKNKTSLAFTLGNRNIPAWVVGMSIFATYVSSISYLALPGNAFLSDWNAFVFSLSIPIAAIAAYKIFVPHYRKINSPSAYTYLEQRFGPWARIYVSTFYLLTQLIRVGTILYLLALVVNAIFGWDIATIIIVTGVTVLIYTILGGIQAVVWTDAIQGIILIAGALLCVVYIIFNMPEGLSQLFVIALEHEKFSLGSYSLVLSESTFWVVLIYGVFINLQNFGIDQNYIQRYITARTDTEAKKSAFWGGMLYIPVSLLFLFIGTALFAFYNSSAATLPPELMDEASSDRIFPYFIVTQLPAGITGLLIAAIFAAGMSTISTSFNSSATVFLTDYFQRYFKKTASDKEAMRVLYISSIIIGIIGITVAILMIDVRSALDIWWKLAGIFSGGMLGIFLLGIFTKSKNTVGVIAVTMGILVILWMTVTPMIFEDTLANQFHSYLIIVFGTVTIFFAGFLLSLIKIRKKNN